MIGDTGSANAPVRVAIVVAKARNGVIGRDGKLPWTMKSDLRWFKSVTTGKPVIMGRKTFESIGKPLKDRTNIVITRQGDYEAEGALVVHDLDRALRIAEVDAGQNGQDEVCVIGGGEIYEQVLPLTGRIYMTVVETEADGDAVFPDLDPEEWHITQAAQIEKSDRDDHDARIEVWARAQPT
ncbi:dihydrofolate reductase [Parvularcula lutaonensis]|uniref:Dihydrofolate reductase n=1 Tax=Parvularcula lutaonensis TaxID=491923 RepID=A0ABV7MF19_9PROT|nr:dihydrofolate reductase [Parvularcula lutaonensis]GGY51955.1 dihydrofolate reductase [Parvularcula lutaonensis]